MTACAKTAAAELVSDREQRLRYTLPGLIGAVASEHA